MKLIYTSLLIVLLTVSAHGQDSMPYITYNIGIPSGDMRDFASDTSYAGLEIGYRYIVQKDISVGFNVGWNYFKDKETGLTEIDNGHVYGRRGNYIDLFPMMVSGHYYFKTQKELKFYTGLNMGTSYVREKQAVGVFTMSDTHWHFAFAPEAGLIYPMTTTDLMFNIKYNYAFEASDSIDYSYWGINIGVTF